MRKISVVTLLLLLMLTFAGIAQAGPHVVLNGHQLNFQGAEPNIENGRTLVPLRAIFEALGASIEWDGNTQTVTATKGSTEIKLVIGGQAFKNGKPASLDVPAKIINGRTMVPLRFVGEALGCQVGWNGDTQTITISSTQPDGKIEVHFIDVGQADAIYISLPDKNDILIDAGNVGDRSAVINYLKGKQVDDIELMIATHPHEDHIGGLPAVLDAYKVERIIDSGKAAGTNIYKEYAAKATTEGAIWEQDNHQVITLGNTTLQILTGNDTWNDLNDYSVVCRLDTGEIELLFTGDAEKPAETALTEQLYAEILKVGHHGSNSSSSPAFLSKVKPEAAIISVGLNNQYGHPTNDTIQRLLAAGAAVYRTDLNGTVVVTTDGKTYSITSEHQKPIQPETEPVQVQPQPQPIPAPSSAPVVTGKYVGSSKSDKYHYPNCRYAEKISPGNHVWFKDEAAARAAGYSPCGVCKP